MSQHYPSSVHTIRRPRGGYLILAPMLLVSCGAAPVGASALATVVGWYLVWVAGIYVIAFGLRAADEWIERRQEFRRQIRQAEAEGYILLARERRARGTVRP